MAHPETRRTLGVLLIILGLLSFSLEFGLFDISEEIVVAGIFFAGGVLLISSFFATRKYWKLVCGSFLIFISIPIFNSVYELFDDDLLGAIFLWWLGGSILLVYIRDRGQWWAIIPAGLFGSLGFLAAAETYGLAGDEALGAILFFGLAATFGYLYLIRNGRTRTEWALWPALFCLVVAGLILASAPWDFMFESGTAFAVLLILIGLLLVWRDYRAGKKNSGPIHQE